MKELELFLLCVFVALLVAVAAWALMGGVA